MKRIEKTLVQKYSLEINDIDEDRIHASNNLIVCLVVVPHNGTENRWMVRFSTIAAFDRWANSCAIEKFFVTEEEVIEYLTENEVEIYKQLVKYLSKEYEETRVLISEV